MHPNIYCSTIYNKPGHGSNSMPVNREMDKEDVGAIHTMECYPAIKGQNNAICSNMAGPRDFQTEWS